MKWHNPYSYNQAQPIRYGQGFLGLAQLDLAPGDLAGNARRILAAMAQAEAYELDAIIFPELSLMGYPIRDVITRHPHLADENLKWLQALAQHTGRTRVIVGFVEPRYTPVGEKATGKPFYNSMAILAEGGIEGLVRKSLLPTYSEFYDSRTFEASPLAGCHGPYTLASATWEQEADADRGITDGRPMLINGHYYGLSICEDTWGDYDFFNRPLYGKDPMQAIAKHKPNVLINISASPGRLRKPGLKASMLAHTANKYHLPLVYVNQVGGVDESVFDGASAVYNAEGTCVLRLPAYEENLTIAHPIHVPEAAYKPMLWVQQPVGRSFDLPNPFDEEIPLLFKALVTGIQGYFTKCGFSKAVLGLSGGLDSAVTAALAVAALGPANVLALSMPTQLSSANSQADAMAMAAQLGMPAVQLPINTQVNSQLAGLTSVIEALTPQADDWPVVGQAVATENVQAISRATLLRLVANTYGALPLATSDKSELYMGYSTVNGDMTGALAPLGDVVKTRVKALAQWINQHPKCTGLPALAIPQAIVDRPPSAELATDPGTGQLITAEDAMMPYAFMDEVIWRIEALQQSPQDMLPSPFYIERVQRVSKAQKTEWLRLFYQRMTRAVFKWHVAPPILICDSHGSIAHSDYQAMITATHIPWWPQSMDDIQAQLHAEVEANNGLTAQPTQATLAPATRIS
jgi:NAD+ synthase (glutamine-hydrolysing)